MTEKNRPFDNTLDPPCLYCKHLEVVGGLDLERWTCKAFPDEIPYAILSRSITHDTVWPGQAEDFVYESQVVGPVNDGFYTVTFAGTWEKAK